MALVEPYPLAFLSDILRIASCQFTLARFEEQSGSGGGQRWSAELDDPLWQVSLSLSQCSWAQAREINAKVSALGTRKSLLFTDPAYSPAAGGNPGTANVVSAISTDRTRVALSGVTAGYTLTAGDRLSIAVGAARYFGEVGETVKANTSGVTPQLAIDPPLPFAFNSGAAVNLTAPVIRLSVSAGGFTPYTEQLGGFSSGAGLSMVQKR